MAEGYVDQNVEDDVLVHFLGEVSARTLDTTKLTRMRSGSVDFGSWRAKVDLVGESDTVRLERRKSGQLLFAELVACIDPTDQKLGFHPTTVVKLQGRRSKHGHRTGSFSISDGIVQTKVEIRGAIPAHERSAHEPVLPDGFERVLFMDHTFVGPCRPRTIVLLGWNKDAGILSISSLHEYVENGMIVPLVTKTLVDLRALVLHVG